MLKFLAIRRLLPALGLIAALAFSVQAANLKPLAKPAFFDALKKAKRANLLRDLRERGCDFRLTSAEETEALKSGADYGLLVAVKMNYRDPNAPPPKVPPSKSKSKDATPGSAPPPRTPRTPN